MALQVLEAAKKYNSPVMIQFSNGGSQFYAGKSLPNPKETLDACVIGAVAVSLPGDLTHDWTAMSPILTTIYRGISVFGSRPKFGGNKPCASWWGSEGHPGARYNRLRV
jgi:hypothetical protein